MRDWCEIATLQAVASGKNRTLHYCLLLWGRGEGRALIPWTYSEKAPVPLPLLHKLTEATRCWKEGWVGGEPNALSVFLSEMTQGRKRGCTAVFKALSWSFVCKQSLVMMLPTQD
jgi:hypothetical protein